jgi:multidrug resistance protein
MAADMAAEFDTTPLGSCRLDTRPPRSLPFPVPRSADRRPLPAGFATIWTTVALDLVGFGIVLPILPLYAERFGAGPATVGLLVATFSVAQLVFAPLWGRLSDRVGRRPVLLVSLVGTAVGSLLTGLAGSLWVLFAGRVVDGVSGASVSVAQASVVDLAPPEERARLLGLLGAAFGLGFVAGPALGALAALGGPEVPFLLAAGIAAVNALVAARRLPETRPVAPAADAVAAPPVRGDLARLAAVAFVSLVAFSGFEATFALLGEARLDLTISSTGAVFAAIGVVLVAVQVALVHPVNRRLGEATTLRAGLALDAVGLCLLAAADGWPLLVPALLALVVGQGLVTPTLSAAVGRRAGAERRGAALGVQQSAGGLARVAGPAAAGALFEHLGIGAPYVVGAVLALIALALVPARVVEAAPAGVP